jgi:hypothetical protein
MIITTNNVAVGLWEFEQRLYAFLIIGLITSKIKILTSRDCSVGIVARLRNGRLRNLGSISLVESRFFVFLRVQPDSGAHPASYLIENVGCFAEDKNDWIHSSSVLYFHSLRWNSFTSVCKVLAA